MGWQIKTGVHANPHCKMYSRPTRFLDENDSHQFKVDTALAERTKCICGRKRTLSNHSSRLCSCDIKYQVTYHIRYYQNSCTVHTEGDRVGHFSKFLVKNCNISHVSPPMSLVALRGFGWGTRWGVLNTRIGVTQIKYFVPRPGSY